MPASTRIQLHKRGASLSERVIRAPACPAMLDPHPTGVTRDRAPPSFPTSQTLADAVIKPPSPSPSEAPPPFPATGIAWADGVVVTADHVISATSG